MKTENVPQNVPREDSYYNVFTYGYNHITITITPENRRIPGYVVQNVPHFSQFIFSGGS